MKKIIFYVLACLVFSSCSNMKSDAEKACSFTTQLIEMTPQMMQLSMKASFGDEDSKKEAQKELDELQVSLEKVGEELEGISEKYDKEEWEAYLFENCEAIKKLVEMGEAFQGVGE